MKPFLQHKGTSDDCFSSFIQNLPFIFIIGVPAGCTVNSTTLLMATATFWSEAEIAIGLADS
jgi:hypothetical protein